MVERVRAWVPGVPGIVEVVHAQFTEHAYPEHTHDSWTLLLLDEGAVRYDLDRHEQTAGCGAVTLLPPHVAHTGRAAAPAGFRKRVLYVDTTVLDSRLTGAALASPSLPDDLLRTRVAQLHGSLDDPLAAESRLAFVGERLREHLGCGAETHGRRPPDRLATDLRDLLDTHLVDGLTLRAASVVLHAHPTQLVRRFTAAFGLPPHRYLTGRRIAAARVRLLAGEPIAAVASAVGFHDQAHLHRHFTRLVGTTPARYARPVGRR